MDSQKKSRNNYDRVMSRVTNRSRSSVRSGSNVTRHGVPSSVRVGAKPSVSAVSSGVFSEIPTVLNDYEPDVKSDRVVKRSLVKPRRTLKSLDPGKAKSPSRTSRSRGIEYSRNIKVRGSTPTVLGNGEEWSETHVRQCYSSRSHTRLNELKDEIKAFHETDKLMKLRSQLYKRCGVVLDDVGQVAQDQAVQADLMPDKEDTPLRRNEWLQRIGRHDLLSKPDIRSSSYIVCSIHFEESVMATKHLRKLLPGAIPTKFLTVHDLHTMGPDSSNTSTQTKEPETASTSVDTESVDRKKKEVTTTGTQYDSTVEETLQSSIATSSKSSTKRKIEIELQVSEKKRKKLQLELNALKKEIEAKNSLSLVSSNDHDDEITERFYKLVEWHNNVRSKYKENRYDAEYKLFTLNLYYSCPQTYRNLEKILQLPNESILSRFKLHIRPEINDRILNTVSTKLESLPETAKYCTICIGKMVLKRSLYYNIKDDEIFGLHNVNGNVTKDIASNAYVIMLRGIAVDWKQPIGYAFLSSTTHFHEMDKWLNGIMSKLQDMGIKIMAIVSDQGSNFDKYSKKVKQISLEKPYFDFQGSKIYYIFDVPDMLNCIRNSLVTDNFYSAGEMISLDYVQKLYLHQKVQNLGLIPKITDDHFNPDNLQKVQVKYAAQIFSQSVHGALNTYIHTKLLPKDAKPTAKFVKMMNDLFDILNSSKMKSNNKYQQALSLNDDQIKILEAAQKMFETMRAINKSTCADNTNRIKTFKNFQISIQAIIMMCKDLKQEGLNYIFTRRLSQEPLENFFRSVHHPGGNCQETTPIQFTRAFSKWFVSNMLKNSRTTKCESDLCDLLLKAGIFISNDTEATKAVKTSNFISLDGELDYRFNLPTENALTYVAGYLLFKCARKHHCTQFDAFLKDIPRLKDTTMFESSKAFNTQSSFYEELKVPPKSFVDYVKELDTIIVNNFERTITRHPGTRLLNLLKHIVFDPPCSCFPSTFLLKLFVRFRIFTTIKWNNPQFKEVQRKHCIKVNQL